MDHEKIKPNQIAAARVLLDITQNQLADLSGISASTVKRIESGLPVTKANLATAIGTLEKAGIEFIDGNGGGVKLRKKGVQAADRHAQPTLRARPLKNYSGWYVLVTWPDGTSLHVDDFKSEAEAESWIEHDSSDWLSRHPKFKGRARPE